MMRHEQAAALHRPRHANLRLCAIALTTLLAAPTLVACNEEREATYADPTSLLSETTQNGITLEVISPVSSYTTSPLVDVELRVTRTDAAPGDALVVSTGILGGLLAEAAEVAPETGRYRQRVSLEHGRNTLVVEVRDTAGRLLRDARFTLRYDGSPPGLAVVALGRPVDGGCENAERLADPIVNTDAVCVIGRASETDTLAVQQVLVEYNGGEITADVDAERRFSVLVPLTRNTMNALRVVATASNGERSATSIDVRQDAQPPTLVLTSPASTDVRTDVATLELTGTVEDEWGLDALRLETGNAGVTFLPLTTPWQTDVRLENGPNPIRVIATDRAGNETEVALSVFRERVIRLRIPEGRPQAASLRLDRTALEALIAPDERGQIELVAIPLRGTIRSALTRLSDPETYGIDTSTWGESEFNLQRLLTTTPDTADLTGSSLELLLDLSQGIGLPPPRLTAQLFNIGVTDRLLTIDVLTDVFLTELVGTHPAVVLNDEGEPVVQVTLDDALNGLRDLGSRYGARDGHPGFLVGDTSSTLFEPGFAMTVDATTNLVERQGVNASESSKDYLYVRRGAQGIAFDFLNPDAFSVVGLVNEPVVDLRFRVDESPTFFVSGAEREARPDGTTGAFRGSSPVWDEPRWVLERMIAESVYRAYRDQFESTGFQRVLRYSAGAVENAATITWNRGWLTLETSGGLGDPPPPFYAWDLLIEVAQLRLHDGGLAEGEANAEFVLRDLPVGVTADELVEALRPSLQAQEALLSDLLVGESGLATSGCDIFLEPATDDGAAWLFFREPSDTADGVVYPRPGFFSDPGLTQRISQRVATAGTDDDIHEKLRARENTVAYFADETDTVYMLRILRADETSADVLVSRVEGTP